MVRYAPRTTARVFAWVIYLARPRHISPYLARLASAATLLRFLRSDSRLKTAPDCTLRDVVRSLLLHLAAVYVMSSVASLIFFLTASSIVVF
jgi:hypothetical protein